MKISVHIYRNTQFFLSVRTRQTTKEREEKKGGEEDHTECCDDCELRSEKAC